MCFSQKVLTKLLKFLFAGKREQCDGKRQHKKIEKIPGKKCRLAEILIPKPTFLHIA